MKIETFKHNGFTISIKPDEDTETPRQPDEIGCQLVMSHKRYDWPNDAGINFDDFDGWAAIAEELSTNHGALVVANVYAYEHSGVSFKTGERAGQFADQWDSGVAGLAYVTAEDWKRTQIAAWSGSAEDIAQARKLIAGDVQLYGQWANCECYGYTITDEYGYQVAESWGFIGWDAVEEAAKEAADELEHVAKCNGTLNRESGEIDHAGPCPLHAEDETDPNAPALAVVTYRQGQRVSELAEKGLGLFWVVDADNGTQGISVHAPGDLSLERTFTHAELEPYDDEQASSSR